MMAALPWLLLVHLLGAVLWVGGAFFLLLVLRPAVAVLEPAPRLVLTGEALRRYFRLVWHAMPLILLTGYAMVGVLGGFAAVPWPVHVMHLFGLIMTALFVFAFFVPFKRMRAAQAAGDAAGAMAALATTRRLMFATLILGLLTVAVAAFA